MDPTENTGDAAAGAQLGPGTRLGRYQLLHAIARGGMAVVWAARLEGDRGFSKLVAIKTALPALAENAKFETMFLDEAELASSIQHPNVVQIFELGEAEGVLYIAMEWVHGDSLSSILRAKGSTSHLDLGIAARIVADACAGLHAVHELTDENGTLLNVIHRDISPHNLLVSMQGHVKVADFGIAKSNDQLHHTTVSEVKGKLSYMSPEQLSSDTLDRRSDVFSMGCVLYEATVGVRPFRGASDAKIMYALLKGEFEAPSKVDPAFDPELEKIVVKALAPAPADRFASAEEMRAVLETWLAKSGRVATTAQVSALVAERLGSQIEDRRRQVRTSLQDLGPPEDGSRPSATRKGIGPRMRLDSRYDIQDVVLGAPSSQPVLPTRILPIDADTQGAGARGSAENLSLPGTITSSVAALTPLISLRPDPRKKRILALTLGGVLFGSIVGGGVFVATRGQSESSAGAHNSNVVAAVPSPSIAAASPAKVDDSQALAPALSVEPLPPTATLLAVDGLPARATLMVDGVAVPVGTRDIARPKPGRKSQLVIRAPGFKEQSIAIDDTTASPLVVKLSAASATTPVDSSAAGSPLPDNPFQRVAPKKDAPFRNPYQ